MNIIFDVKSFRVPPGLKLLDMTNVSPSDCADFSACIVCGTRLEEVINVTGQNGRQQLSRGLCLSCGYFGVKKTFTADWVDNLYKLTWADAVGKEDEELGNLSVNQMTQDFISRNVSDKSAKILDAGAGFGSSIQGLKNAGYKNIQALELSSRRARVLKKKFPGMKIDNIPVKEISNSSIIDHKFDVIYMWHVLEHVADLEKSVKAIAAALNDGGIFFVAVPNFREEHILMLSYLHVHLHSFFPETLEILLAKHGLKLVEEVSVPDGSGIRAVYRKTSENSVSPSRKLTEIAIKNSYHEKLFRDTQLMHLMHDNLEFRDNFLLGFHDNSSPFGTALLGHPLSFLRRWAYTFACWSQLQRERRRSPATIFLNRVGGRIARSLALPYISILIAACRNWPSDVYPFRLIFNSDDLIRCEFRQMDDEALRVWIE
jgi:2-polyprenyl-3-methyl-5-hydroxy-6-metoxy-1,4-benzoquinol methylase